MRAQVRGLDQASRNAQDGQAMINATEGGLQEITNIIQRVRVLAVQAANDTNTNVNRDQIAAELNQLHEEVLGMQERVEFNTIKVLDEGGEAWFQVGANSGQSIKFDFSTVQTVIGQVAGHLLTVANAVNGAQGIGDGTNVSDVIDQNAQTALDAVSMVRANLGAVSNRIDFTMRSLDISSENLADAESRVRNADMAREMMAFTQTNVLAQAATAMLAQANQIPNNLLQILR
jgi:flagellin